MEFINCIYVLTFAICVVIVSVHHSDADVYTNCLNQFSENEGINIDLNGSETFEYIFRNLDIRQRKKSKNSIFKKYVTELFESVIPVFDTSDIKCPLDYFEKTEDISDFMKLAGAKKLGDVTTALNHGYFNVVLTNDTNDVLNRYYTYAIQKIMNVIDNIRLPGPIVYCNEYSVSLCINRIAKSGEMNNDLNATDAFNHIYRFVNFQTITNATKGNINKYAQYLLETAFLKYNNETFKCPMAWCVDQLLENCNQLICDIKEICNEKLEKIYLQCKSNPKRALKQGYYNLDITSQMNELTKEYYLYVIEKFLPCVGSSGALGIKEYCNSLYSSTTTESADFKNHNNTSTKFSSDHQQSDYSGIFGDGINNNPYNTWLNTSSENTYFYGQSSNVNFAVDEYQADQTEYWPFNQSSKFICHEDNTIVPDQYHDFNMSSASVTDGSQYPDNTNYFSSDLNQLGIQGSGSLTSTSDVQHTPTLFFSSNEDELDNSIYKPSFYD